MGMISQADVSTYPPSASTTQVASGCKFLSTPAALHCLKHVESPLLDNVLSLVPKCRNEENADYAHQMHLLLCEKGLEALPPIENHMVPMFVTCGSLPYAQQAFHKLLQPNVYSWTSLIYGYMDHEEFQHALALFQKMQDDGVHSSVVTFLALVRACGRLKHLETGYEMHTEVVKVGFESDVFLGSTLVDMYARCNSMIEAQTIFNKLHARDAVTWNTLIAGFVDCEHSEEALNCLERMQEEDVPPDALTCVYTLKACIIANALDQGQRLHKDVVQEGLEGDSFIGNILVDFYAKFGLFTEAQCVLDELLAQDVVPWTALIAAFIDHGHNEEVLECYERMCSRNVHPNAVTSSCVLKACCNLGCMDGIRKMHAEVLKRDQDSDQSLGNILVYVYACSGCFTEAHHVFDRLHAQDVIAWTGLLGGYVEHGRDEDMLGCLRRMEADGVSANAVTIVCILRASGRMREIDMGRQVHSEIMKKSYESDPSVGNALIDMYAKCSSFEEACVVFDMLPIRNVVTWNTLITACTDAGLDEDALNYIAQMGFEGMPPSPITLSCSLKCCSRLGALDWGQIVHVEIIKEGLERDSSVGNTIVDLYTKFGLVVEAQEVFDELLVRDVVSWTALIAGYAEHGYGEEALQCLDKMQVEGASSNAITLDCCLKAWGEALLSIDRVQQIHADATRKGYDLDVCLGNSLVAVYVKCGYLEDGRAVFDNLMVQNAVSWNALIEGYVGIGSFVEAREVLCNLPVQDVISWTALIVSYVEQDRGAEALYWFKEMQSKGISPDAASFACGLKACATAGIAYEGQEMHAEIVKDGLELDKFLCNSLLDMYAKCGLLAEAQDVFDELLARDVISWTALTAGYASLGNKDAVLDCMQQMQAEHVSPNLVFWNSILLAMTENGEVETTLFFVSLMQEQGQVPDGWTVMNALKGCGKAGALACGKRVHTQVNGESGIDPLQQTALMDMYGKCGSMTDAKSLFDSWHSWDLVKWNALIVGYARIGDHTQVFYLFESMKMEGIEPNEITYLSVLLVCSHAGMASLACTYFEMMCRWHKSDSILKHFNVMASLLGHGGQLEEAVEMLERMAVRPDPVTWRTLLASSSLCNDIDVGLHVYDGALASKHDKYSAPFVLLSNIYAGSATASTEPMLVTYACG